ncbi:MAG: hypothetical protein U9N85_01605, partial [Bacteroidota bacterium]|nr:hypothetical protein [Bacteroidota bacterium]
MKKVQLVPVFIFLILSQVSFGQTGHPHIVNFDINENYTGSKIKSITFDQKYNVYVAGRKGVALFNGNYWRSVNDSPSNVNYILADSSGQKIYTAAKNDFGFIRPDSTLTYHYKSLKKPNDSGQNFSKIILTPAKVIFYSQSDIYIISLSDDSDRIHLSSNETGDFAGLFALKDQIYINIVGKGMHKLNGSTPEPMSAGKQFQNSKILFSAPYNKYSLLLGTNENKIYIFTGRRFKLFTTKTDIGKFLKENILWNGARFSKNQFVLTTLTGGAVFVDRIYGKIQQTVNYQTGLPDDEITAFAVDKNNGLWLAHQHGLSRCNINSVVKNYSSYPGVYGNLNDIINFKDSLYVASNEGVYKLSKIKNYREKQILIKKKAKYGYKFTPKLTYILQSVDYKFIPAEGLSDKCKMLYNLNDSTLLAFSDYGIFSITDTTANQLIEDIYINDFCTDADTSSLYVATLKGVSQINYHTDTATNRAVWSKQSLYESPRPIYSVTQNSDKSLFFGSDGKAYYMQPDTSGNYSDPTEIKFP